MRRVIYEWSHPNVETNENAMEYLRGLGFAQAAFAETWILKAGADGQSTPLPLLWLGN